MISQGGVPLRAHSLEGMASSCTPSVEFATYRNQSPVCEACDQSSGVNETTCSRQLALQYVSVGMLLHGGPATTWSELARLLEDII